MKPPKRKLPKHHQDLVDRTRPARTYAQAGEEVTCTNGHTICIVREDIPVNGRVRVEYFQFWTQPTPAIGESAADCGCRSCGALWFSGNGISTRLHFAKGGWR